MPDRASMPYVSQDDTWSFATRMGIFRKTNAQKHVFRSAKTPVRALFHLETRTIFLTKNHNTSPFSYPFLR